MTLLGESRSLLYGDVSEQANDITMEKLYEFMKSMDNSINRRLNSMSETIEAKNQKIEITMKKVDEMCEQMVKLSTRVNIIEQELGTINQVCGDFQKDMQGMSNVFDGVKEQVEKSESNIKDLTNRLNEAVSNLEQYKNQREVEIEELKEKSENLSDDIIDLRCRSMSYNLIFNGIEETPREDTEEVLHNFLH